MKKIILLIIPLSILLIIAFMLFKSKKETFYLDNKYYEQSSFVEIDNEQLKSLEEEQRTFVVFIYQPMCTTSNDLNNLLIDFMNEYNLSFYKVPFSSIENTSMDSCVKYYPSVVIYHKGEVVDYLEANKKEHLKHYKNKASFKSWFTNYIVLK